MKRGCLGTGALVVGALFSIGLSAIGIAMLVSPPRYIDFTCDRATETCVIDNHVVRRSFPFADIDKVRTHHGFSRGNGASNALELLLKNGRTETICDTQLDAQYAQYGDITHEATTVIRVGTPPSGQWTCEEVGTTTFQKIRVLLVGVFFLSVVFFFARARRARPT